MKNIVFTASFSGGKDSTAMVLRLIEEGHPLDEVVYFNIGNEFKSIYTVVEKIRALAESRGILFTELKPDKPFEYYMLEKEVTKRDGTLQYGYMWCGGKCRWGTKLKLDAIKKHEEDSYEGCLVVEYVGIADDERSRIKKRERGSRLKVYPLVEWGMNEKDCLEYCHKRGFYWVENGVELYDILDRVSCKWCSNKNLKELRAIRKNLPDVWDELMKMQKKISRPYKQGKTVMELDSRFASEDAQLTIFSFL